MPKTVSIALPNNEIADYETEFTAIDGSEIVERLADGKYAVGYLALDEDGGSVADLHDLRSNDLDGGRQLFDWNYRHSDIKERAVAREMIDRLGSFLPDAEAASWEALIAGDYLEGDNVAHFLNGESALKKHIGHDFTVLYDGKIVALWDEDAVSDIISLATNGATGNEEEELADIVEGEGIEKGDKLDLTKLAVEFDDFDNYDPLMAFYGALADAGAPIWPVECYQHGAVHYSLKGSRYYPDRQWDVGVAGFYIPPTFVVDRLKEGDCDLESVRRSSNSALDTYSDWCNGSVYGVCVEIVKVDESELTAERVNEDMDDATWGFVGHENAEEELGEAIVGRKLDDLKSGHLGSLEGEARAAALRQIAAEVEGHDVRKAAVRYLIGMHRTWLELRAAGKEEGSDWRAARGNIDGLDAGRVDFSNFDLTDFSACSAKLYGAKFDGAVLRDTSFREANLRSADFRDAKFEGCVDFTGADLSTAHLPRDFEQMDVILDGAILPQKAQKLAV